MSGTLSWHVPGRVEVFGKHTDYAGGSVLVCAIDRGITVSLVPAGEGVRARTDAFPDAIDVDPGAPCTLPPGHWGRYVHTAAARLQANFGPLAPCELTISSDLPPASGMSSSSALLSGVALTLAQANGFTDDPRWRAACPDDLAVAGYLACVENGRDYAGLPGSLGVGTLGGSEDHVAMLCGRRGRLSSFSFDPLRAEQTVPLADAWSLVIGVSGVRAEKTGAAREAYNDASRSAAQIVASWNASTGRRDATLAAALRVDADGVRAAVREDAALTRRLDHFVAESGTHVPAAVDALARGDVAALGAIADRSQTLAATLLGNQIPETTALASLARQLGAAASTSFGAGFGGSVWALVPAVDAPAFADAWLDAYRAAYPQHREASTLITSPAAAARRLDADEARCPS